MEKPHKGNARWTETFNGFEISIPVKKNWFVILFLGFWLCGWAIGLIVAGSFFLIDFGNGAGFANLFILIWLGAWIYGGFFAMNVWYWNVAGKELITIGKGELTVEKKGVLFVKPKTYALSEAQNFRVQENMSDEFSFPISKKGYMWPWGSYGIIRFDYGLQTIKFGCGLDEAEAVFILEKLKSAHILTDKHFD